MDMMYLIVLHFLGFIVNSICDETITASPTTSPMREFVASPRNITVLEGHPAVLRCKMKDTVHNCQWYYLEFGKDMLNSSSEAVLVKEFRPTKNKDCSIKFSKARLIQSGQWICKGLQIHARKYVVSKPAFVRVLSLEAGGTTPRTDDAETTDGTEEEISSDITFERTDEGYIINTKLNDAAVLGCQTNKELKSCSWIKPDGTRLKLDNGNANYAIHENFTSGNCSILINEVSARDEGNWRCVVSAKNMSGNTLGPLIHLHVLEFGAHAEGIHGFTRTEDKGNYLIEILVSTSVVLVIIIVSLLCYMYTKVWRRNSPPHKYLGQNMSGTSEYSSYGSTPAWIAGIEPKDQRLIDESIQMSPSDNPTAAQYSRYLDMTGNGRGEGYIMFPASSVRSSMSSRTTLSTFPVGQNAIVDTDSPRTSAAESLHSSSTVGNPLFDGNAFQGRGAPLRQDSVCSEGHLYEEIDECRMRRKSAQEDAPDYANIDEDQEGYMIPKKSSPENSIKMDEESADTKGTLNESKPSKASPYSKVGEHGLVPDSEAANIASNPTYSGHEELGQPPEESYDVPQGPPVPLRNDVSNGPPVPLRNDSADNALSTYDVPKHPSTDDVSKHLSTDNSPVFV